MFIEKPVIADDDQHPERVKPVTRPTSRDGHSNSAVAVESRACSAWFACELGENSLARGCACPIGAGIAVGDP